MEQLRNARKASKGLVKRVAHPSGGVLNDDDDDEAGRLELSDEQLEWVQQYVERLVVGRDPGREPFPADERIHMLEGRNHELEVRVEVLQQQVDAGGERVLRTKADSRAARKMMERLLSRKTRRRPNCAREGRTDRAAPSSVARRRRGAPSRAPAERRRGPGAAALQQPGSAAAATATASAAVAAAASGTGGER